ncbi:hypothetical protein E9232_005113 [Inquilinus ginsengisoli]|uniref:DUF945 family protein n=1 Tax=Inquilinus ginsengisoli TaxID=363840 RepID=A0ABU1JVD3_9PROT|nr:hypothetical protein [Inquilinus ginsengisoli]MDR6292573.1 hypothetical protein [Inquilinus ginsengisoli]
MRRMLSLAGGLVFLFGASDPACAQATAECAAKLKTLFEAWLAPMEKLTSAEARYLATKLSGIQIIGQWQVEPDGDGYRIQTPGFRTAVVASLSPVTGELMLACEPDQWHATPAADGAYALGADAPPTCRLEGEGGSAWPITAERRQTTGSVDLNGAGGLSIDTVLERVSVGSTGNSRVAAINRLTLTDSFKLMTSGRSDLTEHYILEGASFAGQGNYGTITADLIAIDSWAQGADIPTVTGASVALVRRLTGLADYPRPMSGMFLGKFEDIRVVRPFQEKLLDGWGTDGHAEVKIEGLQTSIPDRTIRIGNLTLRTTFTGLDQEAGDLTVRIASQGISAEPSAPYTAWMPAEGTIEVSFQSLPLRALLANSMLPGKAAPEYTVRLLNEASSRILIETFHFTAPQSLLDLTGAVWSAGETERTLTGQLHLRLAGLDDLLERLKDQLRSREITEGLSVLRVLGRQITLPDGGAARDYEIVLDPENRILVNGSDVRGLLRDPP